MALDKKHLDELNRLRKRYYISHMQPELFELYQTAIQEPNQNESAYGILDLVGSVHQMTISERNGEYIIKGGSWFSENPQLDCQAWAEEKISKDEKRMDVGFRCVRPIFSTDDLNCNDSA